MSAASETAAKAAALEPIKGEPDILDDNSSRFLKPAATVLAVLESEAAATASLKDWSF